MITSILWRDLKPSKRTIKKIYNMYSVFKWESEKSPTQTKRLIWAILNIALHVLHHQRINSKTEHFSITRTIFLTVGQNNLGNKIPFMTLPHFSCFFAYFLIPPFVTLGSLRHNFFKLIFPHSFAIPKRSQSFQTISHLIWRLI